MDVLPGNRVLELRARGTSKGSIATALRDGFTAAATASVGVARLKSA